MAHPLYHRRTVGRPIIRLWAIVGLSVGLAGFASGTEASINLKIMVVNPSETEGREVQIKSYLPQEVKPEHVLELDGLQLEYDPQAGAHYVSGTVSLKPKESIIKTIYLEDVWMIPPERFEALRQETRELTQTLATTAFEERGKLLAEAIERRLAEVESSQEEPFVTNPQLHISRYRENLKALQLVEADLVSLRQLMVMAAISPATEQILASGSGQGTEGVGEEPGRLSLLATWRMIFIILALLGTVSLSFFLVWQRQLKLQLAQQAAFSEPNLTEPPMANEAADNGRSPTPSESRLKSPV